MLSSLLLAGVASAKEWAVLVAGSNGYGNYRHQADICHAYQTLKSHGIPDEQIIVFQYDDIASSTQNPFRGQMFNKPTTGAGKDVYAGCKRDYTGTAVTPAMFLAALTGDSSKTGGRPVLTSTADDNVFVFFSDHGATGIIAFPTTTLSATDLNNGLKVMKDKKMFKKLVFYLEACESGSMFEGLVDPKSGIYATTASGADESSWGTYCPPDDKVNGKELNTCLGDLYSINWMENTDSVASTETLQQQFEDVKTKTTLSKVMQYGDLSYLSDPISAFIGDRSASSTAERREPNPAGIVNSRDIPLHLAYYRYLRADKTDISARLVLAEELQKQVAHRVEADVRFMKLAQLLGNETHYHAKAQRGVVCGDCCDVLNQAYYDHCGGFSDYSLQYARVFHNICTAKTPTLASVLAVADTLKALCHA